MGDLIMPIVSFRTLLPLWATTLLLACSSTDTRQSQGAYVPRVAPDAPRSAQLPDDIRACEQQIASESNRGLSAQKSMVLLRGCLIQRGHVMLN